MVPLSGEEKKQRELEAEKRLASAYATMRGGAVQEFKPDSSKSAEENEKAKRQWQGEQKLQLALQTLQTQKEAIAKSNNMDSLGRKAAVLQQQRAERKNRRTEAFGGIAWPSIGPVLTPSAPAAGAAPAVTVTPAAPTTQVPAAGSGASSRLENSVVQLLNIQIERLTAEVQRKGEELTQERERADALAAAASATTTGGGEPGAAHLAELEEIRAELRAAQQRAEDAEAAMQRVRSTASSSESSAALQAEAEIAAGKEALRRKEHELEAVRQELQAMQKDFQEVESLGIAGLVEKDKLSLEIKSLTETVARQAQKLEALSGERHSESDKVKELSEELDRACQYTDAETARADAAVMRVKELEEERERMAASATANNSEIESLNAMLKQQKERLESLVKQSDTSSGQWSQQVAQMRTELEQMRVQLKSAQLEAEGLRNSMAGTEARIAQELAKKDAELASGAEKNEKEIARLKKTVDAVASGRGRLNELSSLQAELASKEEEFEAKRKELNEEIESLRAEVETLAESNQQLIAALEGGDADNLAAVGSKLDITSLEGRVNSLEQELNVKAAEADRTGQELQRAQSELAEKILRIATLEERLEGAQKENTLLSSVLQTTKASAEALRKELDGKSQSASAQVAQLEGEKKDMAAKAGEMEKRIKEANAERDQLATEIKKMQEAEEERAADIASIRERLNESIQEKWLVEDKLQKMVKEAERDASKPSGLPNMAEVDAKQREMTRKIQDLEGEVKRAKLDGQQAKEKLGAFILKQKSQDEETAKLNKLVKQLTDQMVGMENDLAEAEKQCDEYEAILAEMRQAAAAAGGDL